MAGYEVGTGDNYTYKANLIPVFEVEWIETDSDYVMQRYETIKIGSDIYILKGLNKDVIRT
jgi:hypothetical protein